MATAVASAEPASRKWRFGLPRRLPELEGKWLTLYSLIWAIMLPVALVGSVQGAAIFLKTPAMWTPYGFATTEDPKGVHVDSVFTQAARAGGLRAGDYIVAIDGWRLPSVAGRAASRTHVMKPDGSATTFTVRGSTGHMFQIQLVRSQAREEQRFRDAGISWGAARFLNSAGTLLLPALFISASVLLFIRRRREAVPAALSLSFLMYGTIVNNGDLLGLGITIVQAIAVAATFLLYSALFAFPSGRFEPRWTAIPFLLLFPSVAFDLPDSVENSLGAVFSLLAVAALISRYWKVGPGTERLQLRWAFLGLVLGILLSVLSLAGNVAVAAWQAEDARWVAWQFAFVQPLGLWGLGVMALGLIVSILRFRLYDADAVIGRSAAYAVLTLAFVILFAGSQKLIEILGQQYLGQNIGGLAGGVGAALAAVAIAPMHRRAQRWAERRFQNSLYRLRNGLPPLVGDLRETSGIEQIAGATLDGIVEGVRASRAAMIAGDDVVDAREVPAEEVARWWHAWTPPAHDGIDNDRSDQLFPVRVPLEAEGHGRVGWLLLGARPDGSQFGNSECGVIEEIAEPVTRAVQVALSRSEREERYERRLQELERRLDAMAQKPRRTSGKG